VSARRESPQAADVTALIRGTDGAHREWRRDGYLISTDKRRLGVDVIHGYLVRSYWAERIPRAVVELSIENSLCFGLYARGSAASGSNDSGGPSDSSTPSASSEASGSRVSSGFAADSDCVRQIGFARLVTDAATFAWLGDVFVLEEFRGQGLSKWLMHTILEMPELAGLRRWNLATRDAHGLYEQVGYRKLAAPERYMERLDPDVYKRAAGATEPHSKR
jgi:hypothetical protein